MLPISINWTIKTRITYAALQILLATQLNTLTIFQVVIFIIERYAGCAPEKEREREMEKEKKKKGIRVGQRAKNGKLSVLLLFAGFAVVQHSYRIAQSSIYRYIYIAIAIAKPNQSKPMLNKHYIYASEFNELFVFSIFRKLQTPALCHNHNMSVHCDRVQQFLE